MSAPSDGKGSHNLRMGAIYWGKEIAPMMSDRVWRFNYYNLLKLACHSPPLEPQVKLTLGGQSVEFQLIQEQHMLWSVDL